MKVFGLTKFEYVSTPFINQGKYSVRMFGTEFGNEQLSRIINER